MYLHNFINQMLRHVKTQNKWKIILAEEVF